VIEMICMEAGQAIQGIRGPWAYYVVMGAAVVRSGGEAGELSAGQVVATDGAQPHGLSNAGEGRLVCLAVGPAP
jgi:mannose-6-phosphate isomerase-like protein (cupin superfamily)